MNAKQRALWGRDTLEQHVTRIAFLIARSERCGQEAAAETHVWTRYDDDICDQRNGQHTTKKGRNRKGRKTQDDREIEGRLVICREDFGAPAEKIYDLIANQGDAAEGFEPEEIDALSTIAYFDRHTPEPVQLTPPAPKAKRDRLAWVAVLRDWSAKHRSTP